MKNTLTSLQAQKHKNDKITMVAAYDYFSARAADAAGVEVILVGDSLAMTMLGFKDTLSVTMREMLVFTKAVSRGAKDAFILADMPFMSYQGSVQKALKNAAKFIKKGGANGVKIEGGMEMMPTIKALSEANIPVVAHLGLTPQAINKFGGYKVQGKSLEAAQSLLDTAREAQKNGAFMVLLECVPSKLMAKITASLNVPTIGIGAGRHCDGQVLVWHDLLGINSDFKPKFAKQYAKFDATQPLKEYIADVKSGAFPSDEYSFDLNEDELERLY